ncbi:hypothetical protein U1Q18_000862 [Sarracenia purpurea var. burkii]
MVNRDKKKDDHGEEEPTIDSNRPSISLFCDSNRVSFEVEGRIRPCRPDLEIRVVNWVWLKPKKMERCLREQGFKGNPYKLLYGDTKDFISKIRESGSKPMEPTSDDLVSRILPFYYHHSVNLQGKKYFEWMGPTPRINITDPKLIRSLLNPAFHLEKLKLMVPAMYSSCCEMISKWELFVSAKGNGSCELDVWPYLANLAGDVISRTAFGSNYEEGERIFQLLKEQVDIIIPCLRSIYIPGWRFLPTKTNKRMKKIHHEVRALVRNIIRKRERAMKGEDGDNDLLGLLLKSNLKEVDQEHGHKKSIALTIEEVIEECKLFYFAGQETTSVLLVWSMVLLSKHQKWQILAREEVLTVFGDNKPDFDGLNHLKTKYFLHKSNFDGLNFSTKP